MNPLVVANWKMNPQTSVEAKRLFDGTKLAVAAVRGVSVVVAPPAIFLQALAHGYRGNSIAFAVQHAHAEAIGAFTGETSMAQAKDAGAKYAIIGHAERRALGENNEEVSRKTIAAIARGLAPIICVGEHERDDRGSYLGFITDQVTTALSGVTKQQFASVVIAYEPVWAIGAAEPMRPHDIHETTLFIRKVVSDKFGTRAALGMPILYGGSVDEVSAHAVLREGTTQGLLVGRASLDVAGFERLLIAVRGTPTQRNSNTAI